MKIIIKTFYAACFLMLVLSSLGAFIELYEKRDKLKTAINSSVSSSYDLNEDDVYWANEIMNGGYILHFRHAERDKWIDVQMYDALESDLHQNGLNESRYAENDYFDKAVCLNYRGKIQARAMGESLKHIGYYISKGKCLKAYVKLNKKTNKYSKKRVNYKGKSLKKGCKLYYE